MTVAPNVTVNVKYELQAGFAERLPGREGYLGPAYFNDPWLDGGFFLITLFLLVMCFAIARIVAWRWSKHGLKETTMAAGDGAKTADDRQL